MIRPALLSSLLLSLIVTACAGERPSAFRATAETTAVTVRYDITARPFPEVPLPSDTATRLDPDSITGRYVNISMIAPTELEVDQRTKANRITGFGLFAPVTIPLDVPDDTGELALDLDNVVERQWKNDAMDDDVALIVNIDRESPGFGHAVPLDFGQGSFPLVLERPDNYFDNDPRSTGLNLLFEDQDEDANGNGVLDPGEDTNGDGILGRPNVFPGMAEARNDDPSFVAGVDDLCPFLEFETNTFIFRPVMPLRQKTTYAVVLTNNLKDPLGRPVRSSFDGIAPATHATALEPLEEVLSGHGFSLEDVAFTWSFTTQDATGDLEAIRAGLYGSGPFAQLGKEYPPEDVELSPAIITDERTGYLAEMSDLWPIFRVLVDLLFPGSAEAKAVFRTDLAHVDYIVQGLLPGPNFLTDTDDLAAEGYPADDDETMVLNVKTGEAFYGTDKITWWCAAPRPGMGFEPPFDVAIYAHSYTISRFELFGFLGRIVRFGVAGCAIDGFGHGNVFAQEENPIPELIEGDNIAEVLDAVFAGGTPFYKGPDYSAFVDGLEVGRARDLDNNSAPDTGGDFWTHDLFHTRGVVRQSVVDLMQFIRMLRSFDGERVMNYDTDGDGENDLLGDFDGDGTIDFGGPDADIFLFGGSMGGIISGLMAGIEPAIKAAAPVVGGGGVIDIGIRSTQGGVPEAVYMPVMGTMIVADPVADEEGVVELSFQVNNVNRRGKVAFHRTTEIKAGDRVEVINERNGEHDVRYVPDDLKFRLAVAADAVTATEKRPILGIEPDNSNVPVDVKEPELLGDPLTIRVYDGPEGELKATIDTWNVEGLWQGARYADGTRLCAVAKGLGKKRQTPDFRRFQNLAALVLEPADPISYSRHVAREPLDFSYDPGIKDGSIQTGANMLYISTIGDLNVPLNTGVAMARAAGGVDYQNLDDRWGTTENDVLIDNYVLEGSEKLDRWLVDDGEGGKKSVLFDADDLNFGSPDFNEPNLDPPLRILKCVGPDGTVQLNTKDASDADKAEASRKCDEDPNTRVISLRLPYVVPEGIHGFLGPGAGGYDIFTFSASQIAWFFATDGAEVRDDPCLSTSSCDFFGERITVGLPEP